MLRSPLTVELALLGFLREGPLHGYEIHRRLSDPAGLGLVWTLKQSHLYALLTRLEADGNLTSTVEPQDNRPPRKLFQLTETGRGAFQDWVRTPVPHGRDLRLDFLTKFYFAQREGTPVLAQLMRRQRTACQDWLRAQRAQAEAAREAQPYEWLVCQFRIGQIEAMQAWLDVCEQTQGAGLPSA
jgi:DNA-binding PadR family transcriptional regulator